MPPTPDPDFTLALRRDWWALLPLGAAFALGAALMALIPTGLPPEPELMPAPAPAPAPTPAPWTPAIDPALYRALGLDPVPVPVAERPREDAPEPPLTLGEWPEGTVSSAVAPHRGPGVPQERPTPAGSTDSPSEAREAVLGQSGAPREER